MGHISVTVPMCPPFTPLHLSATCKWLVSGFTKWQARTSTTQKTVQVQKTVFNKQRSNKSINAYMLNLILKEDESKCTDFTPFADLRTLRKRSQEVCKYWGLSESTAIAPILILLNYLVCQKNIQYVLIHSMSNALLQKHQDV